MVRNNGVCVILKMDEEEYCNNCHYYYGKGKAKFGYFERQNEDDCLIHAINNAIGRKVLVKSQVLDYIYTKAEEVYRRWCGKISNPADKMEKFISTTMEGKNTMFSAKIVMDAARSVGVVKDVIKIPGFTDIYIDQVTPLPSWAADKSIMILGESTSGTNHAIGMRDGVIYDSESRAPTPFTIKSIKGIFKEIHAAYVLL